MSQNLVQLIMWHGCTNCHNFIETIFYQIGLLINYLLTEQLVNALRVRGINTENACRL